MSRVRNRSARPSGFRVPLNEHQDSADLAVELNLPVVLVIGLRLGCLSHALLSAEAIARRGLKLAGWIGNHIDPAMARQNANIAALESRLDAPGRQKRRAGFCA